jgi:hypothetical protein
MDPTPFPSDPLPAPRQRPYFILIPLALIVGMFLGYYIRGEGVAGRVAAQTTPSDVDPGSHSHCHRGSCHRNGR